MSKFRDRLEESMLACHAVLWWLQRWWPSAWIHPSTSPDWIGKDEGDIIISMLGHWERVEGNPKAPARDRRHCKP